MQDVKTDIKHALYQWPGRFMTGEELAHETGLLTPVLVPALTELIAEGAVLESSRGYRLPPQTSAERQERLRQREAAQGRRRREFIVTDSEHEALSNLLGVIRDGQ